MDSKSSEIDPENVVIKKHRMQYSIEKGYSLQFLVQAKDEKDESGGRWVAQEDLLDEDDGNEGELLGTIVDEGEEPDESETDSNSPKLSREFTRKATLFNLLQEYGNEQDVELENIGVFDDGVGSLSRSGTVGAMSSVFGDDGSVAPYEEESEDQIESIISHRALSGDPEDIEYKVHWAGTTGDDDDEWFHRIDLLVHARVLLEEYDKQQEDLRALVDDPAACQRRIQLLENTISNKQLHNIRKNLSTSCSTSSLNRAVEQASVTFVKSVRTKFCQGFFEAEIKQASHRVAISLMQEQEKLWEAQSQEEAAVRIQNQLRCLKARQEAEKKRSIVLIQSWMRMILAMKLCRRERSMITVQKIARRMIARMLVVPRLKRSREAATLIQKIARGYLARKAFVALIEKLIQNAREMLGHVKAAIVMQKFWRGVAVRRAYRRRLRKVRMRGIEKEFEHTYKEEHQIFSVYLKPEARRNIAFTAARMEAHMLRDAKYVPPMTEKMKRNYLNAAREEYRWAKLTRSFNGESIVRLPLLLSARREVERRDGLLFKDQMAPRCNSTLKIKGRSRKGKKALDFGKLTQGRLEPLEPWHAPRVEKIEVSQVFAISNGSTLLRNKSIVEVQEELEANRRRSMDKMNRRRRTLNRKQLPTIHIRR